MAKAMSSDPKQCWKSVESEGNPVKPELLDHVRTLDAGLRRHDEWMVQ
jgi:hypothetical protein